VRLIGELKDLFCSDHAHGCQGRAYNCKCGYDAKVEGTMKAAMIKLEALTMALRYIADHKMASHVIREHALLALRDSQHHQVQK